MSVTIDTIPISLRFSLVKILSLISFRANNLILGVRSNLEMCLSELAMGGEEFSHYYPKLMFWVKMDEFQ